MDRVPGFTCACGGTLYLSEGGQLVGCRRCGVYARACDAGGMGSGQSHSRLPRALEAVPTPPRWAVVTTVTVAAAAVLATGVLMAAGILLPQGRL